MGYSPLQGLVMSTRSGDLDPAIALGMVARAQGDSVAVENMLNRKSGLLGLTGVSADIRDLVGGDGATQDEAMSRAAQVYLWRIRKYLGAYLVVTDSGGLQEEAPGLGVPVLVLRDVTERPEAVEAGTARLVGTDHDTIMKGIRLLLDDTDVHRQMAKARNPFGDGHASERIIAALAGSAGPI